MLKKVIAFLGKKASCDVREVNNIYRLKGEDAGRGIVRVHSSLIKTVKNPKGIFERGQFVTIREPDSEHFIVREVMGMGSNYKLFPKTVAIDYDAKQQLGDVDGRTLSIDHSSWLEREYFMCYQETDRSSREGRKNSWQALIYGVFLSTALGAAVSVLLS